MTQSPGFDPKAPTGLVIGRFQPFHPGHLALVTEAARRYGQVAIGVRDMPRSGTDPFDYADVEARVWGALAGFAWPVMVFQLPNVAAVCYGRDVGYAVERIALPPEVEAISGTALRREMAIAA